MKVEITKKEFIGTLEEPSFPVMKSVIDRGFGFWTGGFRAEWDWNVSELMKLSEDDLLKFSKEMKDARNDYNKKGENK